MVTVQTATAKGVAVWGIQLGEDIAISDQPYKVVKMTQVTKVSQTGSQEIVSPMI